MKREGIATRVSTIATMLAMFTSGLAGLLGGDPARPASAFPASRAASEAVAPSLAGTRRIVDIKAVWREDSRAEDWRGAPQAPLGCIRRFQLRARVGSP